MRLVKKYFLLWNICIVFCQPLYVLPNSNTKDSFLKYMIIGVSTWTACWLIYTYSSWLIPKSLINNCSSGGSRFVLNGIVGETEGSFIVSGHNGTISINDKPLPIIEPAGEIITRDFPYSDIQSIDAYGQYVHFKFGNYEKAYMQGDKNFIEEIQFEKKSDALIATLKRKNTGFRTHGEPLIVVYTKPASQLRCSNHSNATLDNVSLSLLAAYNHSKVTGSLTMQSKTAIIAENHAEIDIDFKDSNNSTTIAFNASTHAKVEGKNMHARNISIKGTTHAEITTQGSVTESYAIDLANHAELDASNLDARHGKVSLSSHTKASVKAQSITGSATCHSTIKVPQNTDVSKFTHDRFSETNYV